MRIVEYEIQLPLHFVRTESKFLFFKWHTTWVGRDVKDQGRVWHREHSARQANPILSAWLTLEAFCFDSQRSRRTQSEKAE